MAEKFTPTQQRFLDLLSDGLPHRREELWALLDDEYAEQSTVKVHVCNIRKILRPRGEDIICELKNRAIHYRQVRLLASAYRG